MNEELRPLWDKLSHLLAKPLQMDGDLYTLDDVWALIQSGQAQFWPAPNSVAVTEIKVYPRGKILHVWLAGGELDEISMLTGYMKKFGKEHGCSRITLTGRRGWERALGLRPVSVTLSELL